MLQGHFTESINVTSVSVYSRMSDISYPRLELRTETNTFREQDDEYKITFI